MFSTIIIILAVVFLLVLLFAPIYYYWEASKHRDNDQNISGDMNDLNDPGVARDSD